MKELFNPCYTLPLVLPAELVVALRDYAKQHDTPLHIVVVEAIKQYIQPKENES